MSVRSASRSQRTRMLNWKLANTHMLTSPDARCVGRPEPMQPCDYCGMRNPEGAASCAGCGTSLMQEMQDPSSGQVAQEARVGRPAAVGLALAVMWVPFVFCVLLSGDKQVWRYILMLPGAVPALLMQVRAREVTCYIASALITLVVVSLVVSLARYGPRVFKLALALTFLVFSLMALLTLLMLRA